MKIIKSGEHITIDFEGATLVNPNHVKSAVENVDGVSIVGIDTIIGNFDYGLLLRGIYREENEGKIEVKHIIYEKNVDRILGKLVFKYKEKSFKRWLILKLLAL